eukprot:m.1114469 g.1114469  ORF g.1114469 m.1114469 type:complete len:1591 (-) comp24367_c0_seq2:204-4976(-)
MALDASSEWARLVSDWQPVLSVNRIVGQLVPNRQTWPHTLFAMDSISAVELDANTTSMLWETPDAGVELGVRVSLFSQSQNCFFGNTWVSPMHRVTVTSGRDVSKARIEHVDLRDVVAYLSSDYSAAATPKQRSKQSTTREGSKMGAEIIHTLDQETLKLYKCVGVVELVAAIITTIPAAGSTEPVATTGIGWAPIPLFQTNEMSGSHDNGSTADTALPKKATSGSKLPPDSKRSVRLLRGSPRLLLSLPDIDRVDILHPIGARHAVSATVLSYTLAPCPRFRMFSKLIPPHTMIGTGDCVPGLWNGKAGSNTVPVDLSDACLAPTVTLCLENLGISFGAQGSAVRRTEFENDLASALLHTLDAHGRQEAPRGGGWLSLFSSGAVSGGGHDSEPLHQHCHVARIAHRQLRLVVHNGRTIVHEPTLIHLVIDDDDPDKLVFQGLPVVKDVPVDAHCALVAELQYTILVPAALVAGADAKEPDGKLNADVDPTAFVSRDVIARWLPVLPFVQEGHSGGLGASGAGYAGAGRRGVAALAHVQEVVAPMHHGPALSPLRHQVLARGSTPHPDAEDDQHPVPPAAAHEVVFSTSIRSGNTDGTATVQGTMATSTASPPAGVHPGSMEQRVVPPRFPGSSTTAGKHRADTATAAHVGGRVGKAPSQRGSDNPVSLSAIPSNGTGGTKGRGWTRASEATLMKAGLVKHLTASDGASVKPSTGRLRVDAEARDRRQANEVGLQLLGVAWEESDGASMGTPTSSEHNELRLATPTRVFFTYSFYRFPPIRTPTMALLAPMGDLSGGQDPVRFLRQESDGTLGSLRTFLIEHEMVTVAPSSTPTDAQGITPFLQYVTSGVLQIDVWDGDSHLHLGTAGLPLRQLLRGGAPMVETHAEACIAQTHHAGDWRDNSKTAAGVAAGSIAPPVSSLSSDVISPVPLSIRDDPLLQRRRIGRLFLTLSNVGRIARELTKQELWHRSMVIHRDLSATSTLAVTKRATHRLPVREVTATTRLSRTTPTSSFSETGDRNSGLMQSTGDLSVEERKAERVRLIRERKMLSASCTSSDRQSIHGLVATQPLHRVLNNTAPAAHFTSGHLNREELTDIARFRDEFKHCKIADSLRGNITTTRTLHPSFGTPLYFEYVLTNPASVKARFRIVHTSTELRVLTDIGEHHHFKSLAGLDGPVEAHMFTAGDDGSVEICLDKNEGVHVPFLLTCKRVPASRTSDAAVQPPDDTAPTQPVLCTASNDEEETRGHQKRVRIDFVQVDVHDHVAWVLDLVIVPQAFTVHRTFRFWQQPPSMLKKTIRLSLDTLTAHAHGTRKAVPTWSDGSTQRRIRGLAVSSDHEDVVCQVKEAKGSGIRDICIRFPYNGQGHSGGTVVFHLALYTTKYNASPLEVWQLVVHPVTALDVSFTTGEWFHSNIVVRGDHASRVVQFRSSSPDVLSPGTLLPFTVPAASIQECGFTIHTNQIGTRTFLLSLTDVELHETVTTFRVTATAVSPVLSRVYDLTVDPNLHVSKRLPLINHYKTRRQYRVETDAPNSLGFKKSELSIDPGVSKNIQLRFAPMAQGSLHMFRLYITTDGFLEDAYGLRVHVHKSMQ